MADDMFAGLKKKKKKVQIADLDVEGSSTTTPPAEDDAVRPREDNADLTLKEDEPLDFSDLKKVREGDVVWYGLDVERPSLRRPRLQRRGEGSSNFSQLE